MKLLIFSFFLLVIFSCDQGVRQTGSNSVPDLTIKPKRYSGFYTLPPEATIFGPVKNTSDQIIDHRSKEMFGENVVEKIPGRIDHYEFDVNQNLIKCYNSNNDNKNIYYDTIKIYYDNAGKQVKSEEYLGNILKVTSTSEYKENKKFIIREHHEQAFPSKVTVCKYDKNNNATEVFFYKIDGSPDSSDFTLGFKNEFDTRGNLIKSTRIMTNNKTQSSTYGYDENSNLISEEGRIYIYQDIDRFGNWTKMIAADFYNNTKGETLYEVIRKIEYYK